MRIRVRDQADLFLLSTSDHNGLCFVETFELDGCVIVISDDQ